MDSEALEAALFLPVKRWGNTRTPSYASSSSQSTKEQKCAVAPRRCATDIPSPLSSTLPTTTLASNDTGSSISQHKPTGRVCDRDEEGTIITHGAIEETGCGSNGRNDSDASNIVLHVSTGLGGSAEAVTFAVERLAVGNTKGRDRNPVWAILECAGSANVAPMPGTVDLKREVSKGSGWQLTNARPPTITPARRDTSQ